MRRRPRYHCAFAEVGFANPQIQFQFQPFMWGLGIGVGTHKIALKLGPLAIALWFRPKGFNYTAIAEKDR